MSYKSLFFALFGLAASGIVAAAGPMESAADRADRGSRARLEALLDRARQQVPFPGLAAAWITSDRIVIGTSGKRRADRREAVQRDDVFALCSNLKAFTAMVGASLEEQGRIHWDTTLAQAFPELVPTMNPAYANVTLAQILKHRAGIVPIYNQSELAAVPVFNGSLRQQRAQFAAWALQLPPSVTPGEFQYSNGGYVIAAAMMERAGGKPYEQMLRERILWPLGLSASFDWPAFHDKHQPWGHEVVNGVPLPIHPRDPNYVFPKWGTPAGNASMSVPDYARFAQIHLRALRGHPNVLSQASYRRLHDSALPDGFGLGWALFDCNGKPCNIHIGGSGTFSSFILIEPQSDRAVIIFANADSEDDDRFREQLFALALDIYAAMP